TAGARFGTGAAADDGGLARLATAGRRSRPGHGADAAGRGSAGLEASGTQGPARLAGPTFPHLSGCRLAGLVLAGSAAEALPVRSGVAGGWRGWPGAAAGRRRVHSAGGSPSSRRLSRSFISSSAALVQV